MGASSASVRSATQTSRPGLIRTIPGPNEIMVSDVSVIAPLLGQGGWGKGSSGCSAHRLRSTLDSLIGHHRFVRQVLTSPGSSTRFNLGSRRARTKAQDLVERVWPGRAKRLRGGCQ